MWPQCNRTSLPHQGAREPPRTGLVSDGWRPPGEHGPGLSGCLRLLRGCKNAGEGPQACSRRLSRLASEMSERHASVPRPVRESPGGDLRGVGAVDRPGSGSQRRWATPQASATGAANSTMRVLMAARRRMLAVSWAEVGGQYCRSALYPRCRGTGRALALHSVFGSCPRHRGSAGKMDEAEESRGCFITSERGHETAQQGRQPSVGAFHASTGAGQPGDWGL